MTRLETLAALSGRDRLLECVAVKLASPDGLIYPDRIVEL